MRARALQRAGVKLVLEGINRGTGIQKALYHDCLTLILCKKRDGKRAEGLLLYWTGELRREDALKEFPYRPEMVDEAGAYFDQVVSKIQNKEYSIRKAPEHKVCKKCDLRVYCSREWVIPTPSSLHEEEMVRDIMR